jgi:hypothetical protein
METKATPKAGRAVLRGEMGTSPDDALNETINWLDSPAPAGGIDAAPAVTADSVIELLPKLDDATLGNLQVRVDTEAAERTAETIGARAFRKAYRRARAAHHDNVDRAIAMLEQAEGAVEAFFTPRGARVTLGMWEVVSASPTIVTARTHVRDKNLGWLVVDVRAYYAMSTNRDLDSASISIKTRWTGRGLGSFGGGADGGSEVAIKEFAAWAALQPQP